MKQSIRILMAGVFLIFAFASTGMSQIRKDEVKNPIEVDDADSMFTANETDMDVMTMMQDMSDHYDTDVKSFDSLEQHLDNMMRITDMDSMKVELQKQMNMMRAMHETMVVQQNMFDNVMTSLESYSGTHEAMNENERDEE